MHGRYVSPCWGNALFSFPLQKSGHSRRFGRFTHGALSYQDPTPPAAPSVLGWAHHHAARGSDQRLGRAGLHLASHKIGSQSARSSQCPPCGWSAPGLAALLAQGLPDSCGYDWESDALEVHEAVGRVLGCRGVAWSGGKQCGPLHTLRMQWRGAVLGLGTCFSLQGLFL